MTDADIENAKQVFRDKAKDTDNKMVGSTSYLQRKMVWGYNYAGKSLALQFAYKS